MSIEPKPPQILRHRKCREEIEIKRGLLRAVHRHPARVVGVFADEEIVRDDIAAVGKPHVRAEERRDVVAHRAEESLAQLDAALETQVVFDQVVGGAVVEVDVVAVGALEAIVAQGRDVHGIEPRHIAHAGELGGRGVALHAHPMAVATPTVERAVFATFEAGVEDVAPLDDVAAPHVVVDVDGGAGHVVDREVAEHDAARLGDENAGDLFLHRANLRHQAVAHEAAIRKILVLRPGLEIELRIGGGAVEHRGREEGDEALVERFAVHLRRRADFRGGPAPRVGPAGAHGRVAALEQHRAGADAEEFAAGDFRAAIVVLHKDAVAADAVEAALLKRA